LKTRKKAVHANPVLLEKLDVIRTEGRGFLDAVRIGLMVALPQAAEHGYP
jgi:hypothetical protein